MAETAWREMDDAPTETWSRVIAWNGERVFSAIRLSDGWHEAESAEFPDALADPQPSRWMAFPAPPAS